MDIILASTSTYRRVLLERLEIDFRCVAPCVEEYSMPGETPGSTAERLARSKARAVANRYPDALVIGSDQVAAVDGHKIGKPGTFEAAKMQLQMSSGKEVHFYTGVALFSLNRGLERSHVEPFTARFRTLTDTQIVNYLQREKPYDCAGSFKVEGLGIALFESLAGNDPTSLEGLPLIQLTQLLAEAGVRVLGE